MGMGGMGGMDESSRFLAHALKDARYTDTLVVPLLSRRSFTFHVRSGAIGNDVVCLFIYSPI
jgi:hypothetical protein